MSHVRRKRVASADQFFSKGLGGVSHIDVGFLEGAMYPAPEGGGEPMPVATVAAINEYGAVIPADKSMFGKTTVIPPRPFFRKFIAENKAGWTRILLMATKHPNLDAPGVLAQRMKEQLQDSIATWPADNAAFTVQRKGFNHGLIGKTVTLQNSVDFRIVRKDEEET